MNRLTLYDFKRLPEQKQHAVVHTKGVFLDVIESGNSRHVLFGVEKFFVELKYDVPSNSIQSLKTFKRGSELDKYLARYEL